MKAAATIFSLVIVGALLGATLPAQAGPTPVTRLQGAVEQGGRVTLVSPAAGIVAINRTEYDSAPTARVIGLAPTPVGIEKLRTGMLVRATVSEAPAANGRFIITSIRVLPE